MDQTSPSPPGTLDHAQIRTILFGILLAMFLGALDQTIVATALPTIGRELNDVQNLSWVVTAYLLTSTAVTPLYGKLSDIHGRRPMLMLAIAVFLVGSIACATATNIFVLIAARALQGLGGGGLISLGQTIVGDVVAPKERSRYQGYFATVFVTSSIAGPILGGFFAEHLHWSFIFWINVPLAVAAYLLTNKVLRLLPPHERPHRIDLLGAALMLAATVMLLLALTWGGTTYAWDSAQVVALIAVSAASWVAFTMRLLRAPEPFIPLAVLGNPVVRDAAISTFFGAGAMVGLSIYLPLYFEAVLGFDAAQSGIALVAMMGGTVGGAILAGQIMVRVAHYKRTGLIGLAVATLAMLPLAAWPTDLPIGAIVALLLAVGIGLGTIFPITTTSVQNAVQPHQMGTATGVLNFSRSLGGAILVAALGAIFLTLAVSGGDLMSVQTVIAHGADIDFAPVFRGVFLAAGTAIVLALVFMMAMKELPLRGRH